MGSSGLLQKPDPESCGITHMLTIKITYMKLLLA